MNEISCDLDEALRKLYSKGKPLGFVLLAVQIAAAADDVQSLVSWGIGRTKPPKPFPPLPHVDEWLKIYRNHRTFINEIGTVYGLSPEFTATVFQADLRTQSKASKDETKADIKEMTQEEKEESLRLFQGVLFPPDNQVLKAILDEMENEAEPDVEDSPDLIDNLLASATGQFFIRIWLPCWILHRTYPQLLLRQARLGDYDALDKLLRLDKSIVRDPGIAAIWHEIMHNGSRSDKNRFTKAMADGPKAKLTKKSLRQGLAGLISQLAKQAQCQVTAPEIAKLFDAIARIRSGHIDTNLNNAPDSFYQGVRRNSDWPSIPPHIS